MSQQRVSVPFDVSKYKTKLFFGLTKRQIICFGLGIIVGVSTSIVARKFLPADIASILMVMFAMPFFIATTYTKNGMPLEQIFYNYLKWQYVFPKTRRKVGEKSDNKCKVFSSNEIKNG